MTERNYSLVLPFDTEDSEFCRGFEAGHVDAICARFAAGERIYEDDPPDQHVETIHASNAEMMLRIAETHKLLVRSEEVDDTWIHVWFTRTDESDPR